MEAVRMAAAVAQVQRIENPSLRMSASCPTSSGDCCTFGAGVGAKKFCNPLGLAGDGLSGGATRRGARLSFSSAHSRLRRMRALGSPPRGAAAAAVPVPSLEGESLLKDIDAQDLEKETPSLLEECADLDWKLLVNDLRFEAIHGLQSAGLRALSLKALEKLMGSWIHDEMVDGVEGPSGRKTPAKEVDWSFEIAARDLRMQANLQAAQALAEGVDSTFDWENDVSELHQRILMQGGAEPSLLRPEQRLLQALARAQGHAAESTNQLACEALSSISTHEQEKSLLTVPEVELMRRQNANGSANGKSLFALGAAVATGLAVEGTWMLDAVAAEASPDAMEAASRAPSWLVPAVLVVPPISYVFFNLYRDKVNPYAKVTDWMFGLAVVTIISNIVLMAVWGVRLY